MRSTIIFSASGPTSQETQSVSSSIFYRQLFFGLNLNFTDNTGYLHQYEINNLSVSSCKDPTFTILIKLDFGQLIVVKIPSFNLYYNPSSGN